MRIPIAFYIHSDFFGLHPMQLLLLEEVGGLLGVYLKWPNT